MFYQCPMGQNSFEDVRDKANIRELIEFERYCRDYMHWDEMRACYHDDAEINVSWMKGGPDQFVDASRLRPLYCYPVRRRHSDCTGEKRKLLENRGRPRWPDSQAERRSDHLPVYSRGRSKNHRPGEWGRGLSV